MPTAQELLIICLIAVVVSVTIVLTMHLAGLGEHAVIAAAVASAAAATTASRSPSIRRLRGAG